MVAIAGNNCAADGGGIAHSEQLGCRTFHLYPILGDINDDNKEAG